MWFYRLICAKILEGLNPYSKAGRRYYGKGKKAETEVLFLVGERASRLWEQYVHLPERIKNMAESVYQAVDVISVRRNLIISSGFIISGESAGPKRTPKLLCGKDAGC